MRFTPEQIAEVIHEANRVIQRHQNAPGIPVALPWADFDPVEQVSVAKGVLHALEGATAEESHEAWVAEKIAHGWIYGATKDPVAKTHPCLVPYRDLPEDQKVKDRLFLAIVEALS